MKPGSPADRAVTAGAALAGAALVIAGAWLMHPPSALIFAGCCLLEISIGPVLPRGKAEPTK